MEVRVEIQNACNSKDVPSPAQFQQWAECTLATQTLNALPSNEAELCIRLVNEEESTELNAKYRNKNKPTNVLSFPSDLPAELELPLIGDLVICTNVVKQEAEEQDKTINAHWAHMVVHGTLHLLGYDHIEENQAKTMEALEIKILQELGFENPYQ